MKTQTHSAPNHQLCLATLLTLAAIVVVPSAFAASQTWSNAPVNAGWQTNVNWIGNAAPGGINLTGTTLNNDVATFNSPVFAGVGGASNPILVDDATTLNARSRQLGSILFDTANCGAYVITSLSPAVLPTASNPETGILNLSHNGVNSITIGSAVTNSQAVLVPIRVRLPNSTPGLYSLINNSTNPSATLTINSITHDGATSRAVTFTLGGANTGNNYVTNLSEGVGNNTGGFTKSGSGTWIIAGTSLFPAGSPLNINDGTLAVIVPDAFGAATTATITNTGVLRLDGVTLNQFSFNLRKGGTIKANGTVSVNGVAVGAQTATTATLSTTSASDVFTVGTLASPAALVSGGAADSVLNTAGPGTLIFAQANTYIGTWSFGAATNQISNPTALGTGPNANVAAGAILDLTPLGPSAFVPTTTGFGGSGAGVAVGSSAATIKSDLAGSVDLTSKNINLTFTPTTFSGDTTHPSLYIAQGGLTLSGNTFFINNASGTALGVGTYRLIQSANAITSGGSYAALISGSGTVGGSTVAIQVSGGNVDLVISVYVPKNLVWTGSSLNANWNINSDANWLNGASPSVFNNSDLVTFNAIGSTNPTVTLVGTLAPATATVDTSGNDYTFTGSGQIGGAASLVKVGTGTLNLNTVNSYAGGTIVSNGTLRVGVNNAIASLGSGNVAVYGSGTIDLNNLTDAINGLNGDGSVDNLGGGAGTLSVGNNNNSGTFNGTLKNTSGTLALVKNGNGTETLTAANSFTGGATVNAGTLAVSTDYALGFGALTVNAGTLDVLTTNLHLNNVVGAGGTIANNSTPTTNTLVITNGGDYNGSIVDGTSGRIALQLLGGTLRLRSVNSYSGGTFVASGATFQIGNNAGGSGVTGSLIASNNSTVGLPGGSNPPGTPTTITTVDGGTVTFTSGAEGNGWGGQFIGSATTTNRFTGPVSVNGTMSFSNFLGVVQIALTGNFRFNTALGGGDNTTFVFESGSVHTRDSQTASLGTISGGGNTSGIIGTGTAGQIGTWAIGAKNVDATFHGFFSGSNNLIKIGSAGLTFDGRMYYTNTVTLADPFEPTNVVNFTLFSNAVTYTGLTTVSNGILSIVSPNNLTNSTGIRLAGAGAVLDASQIGYLSNQITLDYFSAPQATNSVAVVTKTVDLVGTQTLTGSGTIWGSVNAAPTTTVAPGFSVGTLTITNTAGLYGTINMELNRSSTPNADLIVAPVINVSGATLNVTNIGPDLVTGDVYQLFSGPVIGTLAATNLPVQNQAATVTYVWTNMLAINGSIKVLSGASPVNPTPTSISYSVAANQLSLSWPPDHLGWDLQTNSTSIANPNAWFTYPGSTSVTNVVLTVEPTKPQVFYRLHLQTP